MADASGLAAQPRRSGVPAVVRAHLAAQLEIDQDDADFGACNHQDQDDQRQEPKYVVELRAPTRNPVSWDGTKLGVDGATGARASPG